MIPSQLPGLNRTLASPDDDVADVPLDLVPDGFRYPQILGALYAADLIPKSGADLATSHRPVLNRTARLQRDCASQITTS